MGVEMEKNQEMMKKTLLQKLLALVGEIINENEYSVLIDMIDRIDHDQNYGIREVAKDNYVSTSTVSRLCSKFGFGYSEMKFYLKNQYEQLSHMSIKQNSTLTAHAGFLYHSFEQNWEKTISQIPKDHFLKLVKRINESNKICILGTGISEVSGIYLSQRLQILGKDAGFLNVGLPGGVFFNYIDMADLIIVFSRSGESSAILKKVEIASAKNKVIVAITSKKDSPLGKMAKMVFPIAGSKLSLDASNMVTSYNLTVFFFIDFLLSFFIS